jgi:hypothetical protein
MKTDKNKVWYLENRKEKAYILDFSIAEKEEVDVISARRELRTGNGAAKAGWIKTLCRMYPFILEKIEDVDDEQEIAFSIVDETWIDFMMNDYYIMVPVEAKIAVNIEGVPLGVHRKNSN